MSSPMLVRMLLAISGGRCPSSSVKPYSRASDADQNEPPVRSRMFGIGGQRDHGQAVELRRLPEADVEAVQLASPVVGDDGVGEQAFGEHQAGPQRHHRDAVRLQLERGVWVTLSIAALPTP